MNELLQESVSTPPRAGARPCPLCGGRAGSPRFPFATVFDGSEFRYLSCASCSTVYVDPVPAPATFARMYAKSAYHDEHYVAVDTAAYAHSAELLGSHLVPGGRVLDYGCGTGAFLHALRARGIDATGVEFDLEASRAAARHSGAEVTTLDAFWADEEMRFDAIHLGDVLEHLPDPCDVLGRLLTRLRPGGLLFAEGPLEVNASPVYWCASLFGWTKRLTHRASAASHPPTHLFRATATDQLAFFQRVDPHLKVAHWEVYETGWPYSQGGRMKRTIAVTAVGLARAAPKGMFGNRFRGIFVRDHVREANR